MADAIDTSDALFACGCACGPQSATYYGLADGMRADGPRHESLGPTPVNPRLSAMTHTSTPITLSVLNFKSLALLVLEI